jgi:hypothetical protein
MEIKLQKRFAKYLSPAIAVATTLIAATILAINLSSAPTSRAVLIATKDLSEGQTLEPGDVREVEIALGGLARNYLTKLSGKLTLNRSLAKGELITKNGVVNVGEPLIPFRLNNLRPISKAISVGDRVDIWATEQTQTSNSTPEPVAFNAIVTLIETNSSMTQNSTSLEIRIGSEYLETLLNATDSNSQLSVILHETLADIG